MNNNVSDEEMRKVQKDYYRNYRLKNKQKMREAQQRFWKKKVLESRQKEYRKEGNNNDVNQ